MEAAFVEIGLEKNGFLYVDEIVGPELEGRKGARKIQDLIKRGQTIMVQAVKDPMKSKGARLTTEISLPGRFLVYVPNGEGSGVSRRLEDAERTRLKDIVKGLDPKGGGIIVRTAAEGASAEDIERDLVFLQRLWKTIQANAKNATAPALVYEEAELPLRIVRDLFAGDFVGARIDDDRTHRRIVSYLKKTSPHMVERVHRYREKEPLFEASGVDAEIRSTLDRRVDLPSGGYLVFDYAEAFTVIDVNTGRFVGSRGKSAQGRLEDTIVKNNLEAVKEVVRQLRLRDIGGIIVIDFIDMANPKNRETVEEALRSELERDRTKTYVVEISPLGLVEMTRQNVTDGPREILTNRCPVCDGRRHRRLRRDARPRDRAQAARDREGLARPGVQGRRAPARARAPRGRGGSRLAELEAVARRRFFLVPAAGNGHVHLDHFEVLGSGQARHDAARTRRWRRAPRVELKLVEVGLHDPTAGVGKLDGGYEVVVAGAAKLVGKKVKATVGRVLEGAAYATLADDAAVGVEPDHVRGRGREADACVAAQEGGAGRRGSQPSRRGEPDDIASRRTTPSPSGRRRPRQEQQAPTARRRRSARAAEPAAAAGGRSRPVAGVAADGRGAARPDGRRPAAPRIHVPPADSRPPREDAEPQQAEAEPPRQSEVVDAGRACRRRPPTARPSASARGVARAAAASARSRRCRQRRRAPRRRGRSRRGGRRRRDGQRRARVRPDVRVDRRLRDPRSRIAAIMRRFCGPSRSLETA